MTNDNRGPWSDTYTGRFYPLTPRPEDIHIRDIAQGLGNICRFTGQCRTFFSVAQHSILVALLCPVEDRLWGLLHDAAEAYIADVSRPVKYLAEMQPYRNRERLIQSVIARRFGLSMPIPPTVKKADNILLATEARDLTRNGGRDWQLEEKPMDERIVPWSPDAAGQTFYECMLSLLNGNTDLVPNVRSMNTFEVLEFRQTSVM